VHNFYEPRETFEQSILDIQKYISEWEKLLEISSVDAEDTEKSKRKIQSLASFSYSLWQKFNENRSELSKHYMESFAGIQAYLASFLLPNIERVFGVLTDPENLKSIESLLLQNQNEEELVLADFGAGPLSATMGFLCVLSVLNVPLPKKITVFAIDRSEKIVSHGLKLIEKAKAQNFNFSIKYLTSVTKIDRPVDIALCVNIFNEIPEKHRSKTLLSLCEKMKPKSLLFVMEPGQDVFAKALGALRDNLIADDSTWDIVAPCTHKKPCPLSNKVTRKDWCWFRHGWKPYGTQKMIDKYTKVDHTYLNYSYVFFRRGEENLNAKQDHSARVVSDQFLVNKESDQNKVLLCTWEGKIESEIISEKDRNGHLKRGVKS